MAWYTPSTIYPANRLRVGVALTALILCLWLLFFPSPYYWAVGTSIGFVPALVLLSLICKDRFVLVDPKYAVKGNVNLSLPLFFVSGALVFRTMGDFHTTSDLEVARLALPLAFLLALAILGIVKTASFLAAVLIAVLYALPVCVQINGLGPPSKEIISEGVVVRKYSTIKPVSHMIVMQFPQGEKHVQVDSDTYSGAHIGDRVCAKDVTGWLGITTRFRINCAHFAN